MENIAPQILEEHNDFEDAQHLVDIEGLSSPRVCNFLNRLVAHLEPGERYLEIGTWRGLTLCSAAYRNEGKTLFACDKFRIWGRWTGFGFLAKRALLANIEHYGRDGADIHFFHTTSQKFLKTDRVQGPVGVYFYDGDHTYEGTLHGVVDAAHLLSDSSILLMDDWNDPVIKQATYDGIRQADLEIEWERHLVGDHSEDGWWNGLGVFHLLR